MKRALKWLGLILLVLVAAAIVLRLTWLDFVVGGGPDTWPTIGSRSWLIVNRRAKIERGDLVLVKSPEKGWLIRRVIALPGEPIQIADNLPFVPGHDAVHQEVRRVSIEGRPFRLLRETIDGRTWTIFDDEYRTMTPAERPAADGWFVLADNREHGTDSRRLGRFTRDQIRGVVWFTLRDGPRPW